MKFRDLDQPYRLKLKQVNKTMLFRDIEGKIIKHNKEVIT